MCGSRSFHEVEESYSRLLTARVRGISDEI